MKEIFTIILCVHLLSFFAGCSHSRQIHRTDEQTKAVSLKARDLFLKGLFYQSEGRHNEALVQFYQALHHDSTAATIYNSIAENHLKLGHYESALILLKNSNSLDPNNLETLDLLADTYFRLRKDEEAIATYKQILELNPYHEDARKYLIFLYEKQNDELSLAKQYEELNELYGTDPSKLEKMAEIYIKYKRPEEALKVYQKILDLDTTNYQIHYLIGNLNKSQNKTESAIQNYQRVLEIKPDFYPAIQDLALLYRSNEQWQSVIDFLNSKSMLIDSTEIFPKLLIAESYYYLKSYDQARDLLLPLLKLQTVPKQAYDLIARVEFEAKNYLKARDYFSQILAGDAKNKYAWLFLGFTYSDMGFADSAESVYTQALLHFPNDAAILAFYGYSLQEQGKYQQAISPLQQAIAIDQDNVNAYSSLAVVYENLGWSEKCDSLYEVALQRFPENALLLNNFAYSLSERNIRLEEALAMAQKAINANPDNAAYLDTIGWIYFKLGNLSKAEAYIKRAIELRENSPVVFEHMGDVYFKMGQIENAKHYWNRALELDDDNENLKLKLDNIK